MGSPQFNLLRTSKDSFWFEFLYFYDICVGKLLLHTSDRTVSSPEMEKIDIASKQPFPDSL